MSIINPETFEVSGMQPKKGVWFYGTVAVTIRGETRRVPARKHKERDEITAHDLVGRYDTGKRTWPAVVTRDIDPESGLPRDLPVFGLDHRSKKIGSIFFKG